MAPSEQPLLTVIWNVPVCAWRSVVHAVQYVPGTVESTTETVVVVLFFNSTTTVLL